MKYLQYLAYALAVVLVGFILYGSYQFYFSKPKPPTPTIVNNYFTNSTQQNTLPVTDTIEKKKDRRFLTLIGSNSEGRLNGSVGYLW